MTLFDYPIIQWLLGIVLILSSLGVILAEKPVHAGLSFLLTLFTLALFYLQLSAEFIAVMQILVYAGAILVIFMYIIVLFQDAYLKIAETKPQSSRLLLSIAGASFLIILIFLGKSFLSLGPSKHSLPAGFGTVEAIGKTLYLDFFFPFEAVISLFLIALVGAVYIARKGSG